MAGQLDLTSGGIGMFSNAVNDLFQSQGSAAEANSYANAANIAGQDIGLEKQSVALQEAQAQRAIYKTLGAQQADVAGGGFAEKGSALDLYRNSAAQGNLQKQALQVQGGITEAGFAEQEQAFKGQSEAASAAGKAEGGAGLLSLAGGFLSVLGLL